MNTIEYIKRAMSGEPDPRDLARAAMDSARHQADPVIESARHKLLAIARARIEGKEFAERRPPTVMNLRVGDSGMVAAQLKPTIVNSQAGWTPVGLTMKLEVGRRVLHLDVNANGSLRGTRWTVDAAPQMLEVARHLLKLFDSDLAYVMAVANVGSCCICGKSLTDPQSRAHGIGPECLRYFTDRHDPRPTRVQVEDLAAQVAEIRRQIQQEHPDRGGSADGERMRELMTALAELKKKLPPANN